MAKKLMQYFSCAFTELSSNDGIQSFCDQFDTTHNTIKKGDIKIVIGDLMNANIVGTINENGEMFVDLRCRHNLCFGSTLFPHKTCHKVIWVNPEPRIKSNTLRSAGHDLKKQKRHQNVGKNHHLVVGFLKIRFCVAAKSHQKINKHVNVIKLANQDTKPF